MAEHKIEDTKLPAARRGARPFVGPASGAAAPRPLLRPDGPPSRPGRAPFAPPHASDRASLGVPRPSAAPGALSSAAPSPAVPSPAVLSAPEPTAPRPAAVPNDGLRSSLAVAESAPTIAPLRPSMPAPSFDTVASATPASEANPAPGDYLAGARETVDPFTLSSAGESDSGFVSGGGYADPSSEHAADEPAPVESSGRRPVTSEMVAIDAFAAFDSVWGASNTPATSPVVTPPTPPVDEMSLGGGSDAPQMWADEITAGADTGLVAPTNDPATPVDADPVDAAWSAASTPDIDMPAWLADDAPALGEQIATPAELGAPAAEEPPPVEAKNEWRWPDPLLAEYAPYVSMPDGGEPMVPDAPLVAPELAVTASEELGRESDPRVLHGLRVSAALDRLAERVRGGEIDVSSVAPEAPDAAVLASVLAALLGGSSSR